MTADVPERPIVADALVLTAGLGTRLRPLTLTRAKPALEVAGEPMIRRIIRWLASNAVTKLVLNLHHLPETISACVGDGSDLGVRVRYSWEQPLVLGSAGGPRLALPILGVDRFFLINGDTLTDLALQPLARAHVAAGALVTLALVPNREPDRYSGVRIDEHGSVVGWAPRGSGDRSYHFIGAQVVDAEVFRPLPPGQPLNTIRGVYDDLIAARPGAVKGVVSDARFWDIGTIEDYQRTSKAFERSNHDR